MTGRDRIVLLAVVAVAALGGFWFAVLAPKRDQVKKVEAELATQQGRLDKARAAEAAARSARAHYDSDYATVARLGKAVPTDDDVPSLVYQLESAAVGSKVDFRSLKLTPGAPSATPTGAGAAGGAAAGASGSASATQAAAATLPPGSGVGSAGFPTMPFSFVFDGSFFSMQRFLRNVDRFVQLQDGQLTVSGRLLSVDGISLTAGREGFPSVKATLTATAYLLPADEGATAGATAAGPAGSQTPTSAPGSSGTATASTSTPTTTGATG
ncbi:MAG TPA: hypothetical protein VGP78_08060 [Solirubrobacteraceae bacterium]|nr:hypothetical protein [Solirubrobacteraceae bacterium]